MKRATLAVLLLLTPSVANAWGEYGHLLVNEAATLDTPAELPPFFHRAYPRLAYLGPEPDRWYTGRLPSIGAVNFPEHFLDYEYVAELDLPADRYRFIDLLHNSGTLRRFGITSTTAGFAPWRIAELCELLTVQWRLWRNATEVTERAQIEENIIHLAGILGHYVADTSNPHHTTIHYNGYVGWPNDEGFRNDCDVHVRFESQFVARAILMKDVLAEMRAPAQHADYFATAMRHVRESNALVEPLYRLDRDGAFDAGRGTPEARTFTSRRLAAGASLLRDLWWSTYRNSEKPLTDWRTQ